MQKSVTSGLSSVRDHCFSFFTLCSRSRTGHGWVLWAPLAIGPLINAGYSTIQVGFLLRLAIYSI